MTNNTHRNTEPAESTITINGNETNHVTINPQNNTSTHELEIERSMAQDGYIRVLSDETDLSFVMAADVFPISSEDNPEVTLWKDAWRLDESDAPTLYRLIVERGTYEFAFPINDIGNIGGLYYLKCDGECVVEVSGTQTAGRGYVIQYGLQQSLNAKTA